MIKVPGGAQAASQALQLRQSAVPDLQLFNPSLQVVGELRQLLHRPHILHEDLLLVEEKEEEEEEEGIRGNTDSTQIQLKIPKGLVRCS